MALYIVFSLLVVALHYTMTQINLKIGKIKDAPLFVTLILLALFMGLRGYTVGSDTSLYQGLYNQYFTFDFATALSQTKYLGWSIYCFVLTKLGLSYRFYLLITSFLMCFFIYKIMTFFLEGRKSTFAVFLFLSMYIYFRMFNAFRHHFAIVIMLYGTTKLLRNKKFSFVLWTLLATSVHSTVIIGLFFLPIYLISKKNYSNEKLALGCWLVALSACVFAIDPLIDLFIKVFPIYGSYISDSAETLSTTNQGRTIILRLVELAIGFFFFATCLNSRSSTKEKFLLFTFLIANIFGAVFYNKNLMVRLANIFLFMDFIAIAYMVEKYYGKVDKFCLKAFFSTTFFALLLVMLNGNYGRIIPYVF